MSQDDNQHTEQDFYDETGMTYTPAQVEHRLVNVPRATLYQWSKDYADFLSDTAQPAEGKKRIFTYNDLVILNTVRQLTRVEGLNRTELVKQALTAGRREYEFLPVKTPEEEAVLLAENVVPESKLHLAANKFYDLKERHEEITRDLEKAYITISDRDRKIADLREERGRIRGIMIGVAIAAAGILIIAVLVVISLISLIMRLLP